MSELAAWLAKLEQRQPSGAFDLGLDRIARVVKELGLRLDAPLITVAGTNGKGSTCAYLEAILSAAGYRPTSFFSPHLLEFGERIHVGQAPVDDAVLVEQFETIEAADQKREPADKPLSYFEFIAVAAVLAGQREKTGAYVLEVGLGGRLDAVNVFDADVAVITTIGIDHVEHLGHDRETIGAEKACIARPGKPLVIGDPDPPASVLAHAKKIGAQAMVRGSDFDFEVNQNSWTFRCGKTVRGALPKPAMPGSHQVGNAACALAALACLETNLPAGQAEVRAGLMDARLGGRFEILPGEVPVVLDVAHNESGARVLANALLDMGYFRDTHIVLGVRARKDGAAIAKALLGRAEAWHIAPVGSENASSLDDIRAALAKGEAPVTEYPSIAAAAKGAHSSGADRIVVCGSFVSVEEYMRARTQDSKVA